jgi:hypothetical protein
VPGFILIAHGSNGRVVYRPGDGCSACARVGTRDQTNAGTRDLTRGARSTDSASPRAILLPRLQRWGSILHGQDFPRTLMRGSPACAAEPVRHRQETHGLAVCRD